MRASRGNGRAAGFQCPKGPFSLLPLLPLVPLSQTIAALFSPMLMLGEAGIHAAGMEVPSEKGEEEEEEEAYNYAGKLLCLNYSALSRKSVARGTVSVVCKK